MIISEKQVFNLIQIANNARNEAMKKWNPKWQEYAKQICKLLDDISNQQPTVLKIIGDLVNKE